MAIPPQPTDAGEPGEAPETSRPAALTSSIAFLIGFWFFAACLLVPPIWFVVSEVLDGLGWMKDSDVVNIVLFSLVALLAAFVWALLAAFALKVTRDWAARRRYFQR